MLFNSHLFLFAFLPVTLLVCFGLARRGGRAPLYWLVATSFFFYGWWSPPLTGMLLGSISFNYCLGSLLSGEAETRPGRRKLLLALGVTGNLLLLGQFKYQNFFIEVANQVTGESIPPVPMILPLAISFFTFQQLAYLVDAYRGETPRYGFARYCLFVTFFPQLIAGPIVHHREILPQFATRTFGRFSAQNLSVGLTTLLIGLFKKVVLADGVAVYARPVFEAAANGEAVGFADAWGGALAYTFQLYFDFSGYSDMAIGLAAMLGIRLPVNFDSPYKATSIIDFWRRWHITLSRFLREYLYIPLGGNRRGAARRMANLMITMLLGGLWHGAGWTFVLWGGLHGAYLALNHGWRAVRARGQAADPARPRPAAGSVPARVVSRALTFLAVVVAWVLFRADGIDAALQMLGAMAGLGGFGGPELTRIAASGLEVQVFGAEAAALLCALLVGSQLLPNTREWMSGGVLSGETPHADRDTDADAGATPRLCWAPTARWAAFAGALGVVAVLGIVERSEFVYFHF